MPLRGRNAGRKRFLSPSPQRCGCLTKGTEVTTLPIMSARRTHNEPSEGSSFLEGLSQTLDIGGVYTDVIYASDAASADADAIASDWASVGCDMLEAAKASDK
jgi:hypothetical protein